MRDRKVRRLRWRYFIHEIALDAFACVQGNLCGMFPHDQRQRSLAETLDAMALGVLGFQRFWRDGMQAADAAFHLACAVHEIDGGRTASVAAEPGQVC